MDKLCKLKDWLDRFSGLIGKVVDFDPATDRLLPFDFTASNTELDLATLIDTNRFAAWVNQKLAMSKARYGIGGYNEHRTIYGRSAHFDQDAEPRRLHLGVDIWGPAGTPIYNFFNGTVHSFQFNNHFGDYGATIIMQYQLCDLDLYILYGHLDLASLQNLREGMSIPKGQVLAHFGEQAENGHWPPHLHLQLMFDMQDMKGDYPGVCQFSMRDRYLQNCPDPMLILKHTFTSPLA